jgi:glutathionylspermidine synthase
VSVRLAPFVGLDPLSAPDLARDLQHRYLIWDAFVAGERRVDVHPLVLTEAAHHEAMRVAEEASALVFRAAARAADDPVERARYRLGADVEQLAAAARAAGDEAALVRVDLLWQDDGRFVACEVNADCPGGHNESLALPRLARAAGFREGTDPTDMVSRLAERLVALSGGKGSPRGAVGIVLATAYAEDLQVGALVERMVTERGGRALRVPVTAIRAHPSGGVAHRGERLAVLYRFYPLEWMEGQRNVAAIAEATARGELVSLSSFAAIHAQSKLAMARAFAAEPALARAIFPETRAFADVSPEDRTSWVLKRDLSRVGDHVVIGAAVSEDAYRGALAEIDRGEREGEVWVAQRFVKQRSFDAPWGRCELTLGVYLLGGAFVGYFARLSRTACCTHDALVLPVFVERAAEEAA